MGFSNFDHYNQLTGSDPADMQPDANPNPIQRLCFDILAEIFTFCLPDVPKNLLDAKPISSLNAPLLLCSVCSSWRSLAISTPRLWQTLIFGDYQTTLFSMDTESITNTIRTWLDRSRTLPLSIRATLWTEYPESDKATKCRLIVEILLQEISRWESFELFELNGRIWVTPPHFGIFPMLHTLAVSLSSFDIIPFTAAPRLKRLSLCSLPNLTSVSAIPWDQLVELNIGGIQTVSIAVKIIQRCPRLESLSLSVDESDEDGSLTFGSITQHDTLQKLHLVTRTYINAVTDRLTLPALADLDLRHRLSISEVEAKFCCSQLVDFFTRSNCGLQEFQLRCYGFGPGELLECLSHQSCQTLTHLLIQSHESPPPMVDRELLLRLTYSDVDDDVPLCPKLAHLTLLYCYCSDRSSPDLLGRMIQSRCFGRSQDAQLRSLDLRLSYHNSVSGKDHELLQFARDNGGLEFEYSL